jgi:hypothetical protein
LQNSRLHETITTSYLAAEIGSRAILETKVELEPAVAEKVRSLSRAVLLEVFDEREPNRRAEAIDRIFAQDVRFIDHNGTHDGRAEIGEAVNKLHARFADFRFTHAGEPQILESAARLNWTFGPPSDPAKITGTDTILIRDGRVSTLVVFLDQAPAKS